MKRVTFSLFGQIEELVARQMMAEGKDIHQLPLTNYREAIPHDVRFNRDGQEVRLVISIARRHLAEFEERIAATRL